MGFDHAIHRKVTNVGAIVVLVGVCLITAAAALAAGKATNIDGTVKEDGTWYYSTNERVMNSGNRTIKVDFVTTNTKGLNFMCTDWNGGYRIGITVQGPPTNVWQTIGTATAGEHFRNCFQAQSSGREKNYNFTGSEFY